MTGLLRAAASEEEAAVRVRDLLVARLLTPLARHIGGDRPERAPPWPVRRWPVSSSRAHRRPPPARRGPPEELVAAVGPVLQHYLVGDLSPRGG